jgi:4-amino-4-deoxy-L-arabinose transferase-like glycosyltransferase
VSWVSSVSANLSALLLLTSDPTGPGRRSDRKSALRLSRFFFFFIAALKKLPFDPLDRSVLLIIATAAAAHAGFVSVVGFSIDETYDVVMARALALSYQDHPPAIMWLIAAAVHLFGSESHFVVRLPTLILSAAQAWLLYRLTALAFDKWAGLLAVVALALSPLFGFYVGAIAVTDGPLLFGLTGAAFFLARGLFNARAMDWRDWLPAGLLFGIACLSKFTAILVLPGVALFLLTSRCHRRFLLTPGPYVAALAALVLFSPVVVWNVQNGFAAFIFQGGRAALDGSIHIDRFISHTGFLFVVMGPAVWLIQIGTLVGALWRGPRDERRWFFATLAIAPIAFFAAIDLFGFEGVQGPQWLAPGYLFTFPLVGAAVARWRPRFPRLVWGTIGACVVAAAVVGVMFVSHTLTGWLGNFVPVINSDYDPLVADDTDWHNLRTRLELDGLLDSRHFLLLGRYEYCFKAELVIKDAIPIACLSANPVSHSLWRDDEALLGRDAVIITDRWNSRQSISAVSAKFASVAQLPPLWITDHGRPVLRVELMIGHDLQRPIFEAHQQ